MSDKMREGFETWAKSVGFDLEMDGLISYYWDGRTERAWGSWQAAIASQAEEIERLKRECEALQRQVEINHGHCVTLNTIAGKSADKADQLTEERDEADRRAGAAGRELAALRARIAEAERQEPTAWRTFDGEGGYDYRSFDGNEDYRDEWEKRNPRHKCWVEPMFLRPAEHQDQCIRLKRQLAASHAEAAMLRGKIDVTLREWGARLLEEAAKIIGQCPQRCDEDIRDVAADLRTGKAVL